MTAKTSAFIATSLDGFIARQDGSIDWLDQANAVIPSGEDCGYGTFMASVDGLIMGRNTFEQVLTFDEWPYGRRRVVVLSRQGVDIPAALNETVTVSQESPQVLLDRLSSEGAQHLYIDGGQTIQCFLQAGILDQFIITTIPILLGEGRPLFGSLPSDVRLQPVSTTVYTFGFVQTQYRVVTPSSEGLFYNTP